LFNIQIGSFTVPSSKSKGGGVEWNNGEEKIKAKVDAAGKNNNLK